MWGVQGKLESSKTDFLAASSLGGAGGWSHRLLSDVCLCATKSGSILQHEDYGQLPIPAGWCIVVRVSRVEQEARQVDIVKVGSRHRLFRAIQEGNLVAGLQDIDFVYFWPSFWKSPFRFDSSIQASAAKEVRMNRANSYHPSGRANTHKGGLGPIEKACCILVSLSQIRLE